ncbi:M56 family metallopeptidase [Paraflavitalea sp. CAU 1676]|uniref:M56 family metallopeptidase n=1 Tax=Paraflavitalea sp. CAU 1676 TaxID=3032598 RepID=UPI0023DACB35|nr:M56 family metallopeptidase [Paraflavitalea sp. CAU 1676]MDF2189900.1 M56 family metallopeptidase [Paraflavitalea sp. CAU 1676]
MTGAYLFIHGTLTQKILQAFTWMLVHSIWQGFLLALLAGAAMLSMRKSAPDKRYKALAVLLAGYLVTCLLTFVYVWNDAPAVNDAPGTGMAIAEWKGFAITNIIHWLNDYCTTHATLIVATWFFLFAFRCWQMTMAIKYVKKVKTKQLSGPPDGWQQKVNTFAYQLGIGKAVTLLESGVTKVPVVIGHLKPVIYMPLGLLANLPPHQVEAVLLHELAHIRRHDYLFNWVQHLAETVFFFNPGLLWVSALLREEREHCCDDIALSYTGNRKQFIQALINFKEQVSQQGAYVMAFPGKKSQLLQRVTRIVHNRNNAFNGIEKGFLLLSAFVCLLLLATFVTDQKQVQTWTAETITATPLMHVSQPANAEPPADRSRTVLPVKSSGRSRKSNNTATSEIPASIVIGTSVEPSTVPQEPVQQHPTEYTGQQEEMKSEIDVTAQYHAALIEQHRRQAAQDNQQAAVQREKAEQDRKEAERHRAQAAIERIQAERHRERAEADRRKAEQDREQAEQYRQLAADDQAKADHNRERAAKDHQQALQHAAQAEKDRQRAEIDRRHAELDRARAERDRVQADKDRARAMTGRNLAESRQYSRQ